MSEPGRPDFSEFVKALRSEIEWIATIKKPPRDGGGQAATDQEELGRLAEHVERVGKNQGYL